MLLLLRAARDQALWPAEPGAVLGTSQVLTALLLNA